jgi:hypothetical protein
MELIYSLNDFFEKKLNDIKCRRDTKAYITSLLCEFKNSKSDLSNESLTLFFNKARSKNSFSDYQKLGDFIFFCDIFYEEYLNGASKEYYDSLARLSYYSCYRLTKNQWMLFEELAEDFNKIENQVKNVVKNKL